MTQWQVQVSFLAFYQSMINDENKKKGETKEKDIEKKRCRAASWYSFYVASCSSRSPRLFVGQVRSLR